ncbi:hypothetical protein Agub_g5674 [Astrephomene gubernaculifera]|uniref:BCNT-C domain-containing protein n=1 Tax=Astrephomene gubernaculifera TaxID=47775 RepID=A0AAD3HL76_9CHLO|nr:hypothetical protein Agub_g5674 [Astrephomene gubernaculifera]
MAGFLNAALPSDDEEDDDYNPVADDTAEREDLPQAAGPKRGASKKRRRGVAIAAEGDGNDGEGGGDDDGAEGAEDEDEDEEDEETRAARDPKFAAKRAKVASLWEQVNARAAANGTGVAARLPSATVNLAALCRSGASGGKKAAKPANPDAIWMRSLGLLPKKQPTAAAPAAAAHPPSTKPKPAEDHPLLHPSGTAPTAGEPPSTSGGPGIPGPSSPAAAAAAVAEAAGPSTSAPAAAAAPPAAAAGGPTAEEKRALAAAALAAARDAGAAGSRVGKVAVTEVRRFAGKDVQVTLHVDKDSREAQRAAARAAAPPPPPASASSGLDAVLAEIDKKKKVSVLDKTKADWSEYKAANTEVDEELEMYKKSGEQYLDKQNFLKRAELREYEKERDTRLASDVRTRGRL